MEGMEGGRGGSANKTANDIRNDGSRFTRPLLFISAE